DREVAGPDADERMASEDLHRDGPQIRAARAAAARELRDAGKRLRRRDQYVVDDAEGADDEHERNRPCAYRPGEDRSRDEGDPDTDDAASRLREHERDRVDGDGRNQQEP